MSDERDPLRSVFDELRTSALPSMRPLGIDQVVTTVRHRRNVRAALATIVVLIVVGAGFGVGGYTMRGRHAPMHVTDSGPIIGTSASVAPQPSLSPSAPASVAPSTVPSHRSPTATHTIAKKPCASDGVGVWHGTNGLSVSEEFSSITPRQEPPCGGVSVPLFWASYTVNPDGTGSLYASGTGALTLAHPTVSMSMSVPPTCGAYFVGHNWASIPQTLPVAVMGDFNPSPAEPFWDTKHHQIGLVTSDHTPCQPPASPSAAASQGQ